MRSRNQITVDAVIPVFNDKERVITAINSVLNQTYPVQNIYVIDDGSIDGTYEAIQNVFIENPRVAVVKRPHQGRSSARNYGVSLCTSESIAFLDSDDVWHPNKIECQVNILLECPEIGCVYSGYDLVDLDGCLLSETGITKPKLKGDIFQSLLGGNYISGSSSAVLVRRVLLIHHGGFNEHLSYGEDWDLWLKLAKHTQYGFVEHPLVSILGKQNDLKLVKFKEKKFKDLQDLMVWSSWPKDALSNQYSRALIKEKYVSRSCKMHLSLRKRILALKMVARWTQDNSLYDFYNSSPLFKFEVLIFILKEHCAQSYIALREGCK